MLPTLKPCHSDSERSEGEESQYSHAPIHCAAQHFVFHSRRESAFALNGFKERASAFSVTLHGRGVDYASTRRACRIPSASAPAELLSQPSFPRLNCRSFLVNDPLGSCTKSRDGVPKEPPRSPARIFFRIPQGHAPHLARSSAPRASPHTFTVLSRRPILERRFPPCFRA